MFLNLEDLTKVSHRDFKGLDTDKRIPRKRRIIEISDQHRRQRHYVKHVRLNLNFSMSVSDGFFSPTLFIL